MLEEYRSPYLLLYDNETLLNGWFDVFKSKFRYVYTLLILKPLARLYISGPSLHGIGFWQDKSPESICAHLSSSDEQFWRKNPEECSRIIASHFYSWVILLEYVGYCLILYKLVTTGSGFVLATLNKCFSWGWNKCCYSSNKSRSE